MIYRIAFILLFALPIQTQSQHLIGLVRNDVIDKMKETSFTIDNTSKNETFNYLKYVDTNDEKTLLVFFSDSDQCISTKMMCDYSSIKKTIASFNKSYKRISSIEWNYIINKITYKVILRKEEWFYSVIITPKSK
jgi:hypothetical protein